MTDEQIIIDGVDVSGCEHLMQGIVPFGCMEDRKTCSCMNNPNCLYKQLKRKEQECEKAKQNAQDTYDLWQALIESFNILQDEKIKLEQECERLKEENKEIRKYQYEQEFLQEQLDKLIKENKEIKTCYKNNLALLNKEEVNTTKLVNKVMKLDTTLNEIKIFVMQAKHDYNLPKYLFDTILQKISECEGNNELTK